MNVKFEVVPLGIALDPMLCTVKVPLVNKLAQRIEVPEYEVDEIVIFGLHPSANTSIFDV